MATAPIRIVLADDHTIFRQLLTEMLSTIPGFEVVADGEDADQAIALAAEHQPDVVLLDIGMPGPDPAHSIPRMRELSPNTKVLIVTSFDDPRAMHDLIAAGASGYLLKTAGRDELSTAIRAVNRTDGLVVVAVSREAFLGIRQNAPVSAHGLSIRETEVLRLLADAKPNRAIAARLDITEATVKRHLSTIYAKLGVTSRAEAIQTARKSGIVEA
ncbi:MAG: response regulator transcription factor [Actinomycetia bacterium]|nr:response regulator transcription factor [Actinomycetes bacterium]